MGLFDRFSKKEEVKKENFQSIYAPITGNYIPMKDIPDEVFSSGIMGSGCGIIPEERKVVSPVDGKVTAVTETKHAIGLTAENGAELLIHIGMDTVNMQGNGFNLIVAEGDKVKCGDVLIEFDKDAIQKAGYTDTIAFVVTNSSDFAEVVIETGKKFGVSEKIGVIR